MATLEIIGFTEKIKAVEEWAEAIHAMRRGRLEPIVNRFVESSQRDAVRFLNRPKWLLSRAIGGKTKTYQDGRKLFGMAGFEELRDGGQPRRNPGYYGKYHESGYVQPLKKAKPHLVKKGRLTSDEKKQVRTVALHFLKRAEMANQPELIAAVEQVNADVVAELGAALGKQARDVRVKVHGLKKW